MATPKTDTETQTELPPAPDAFQKVGAEASGWLIERQKLLAVAAGGLLLVGGGVALASYLGQRGEARAAQELGQAMEVVSRPLEGEFNPNPSSKEQPFKTAREKDEAIQKAMTAFRQEHAGTKAAVTAALTLADAEYRLGNFDAALAAYDAFLKDAAKTEPLRATALEGRGYTLEAQGKLDQALANFEDMSRQVTGEFMAGMGAYHRARILLLQGKKDEAVKAFQEVSANHPDTAAARLSAERVKVLASQGVAIPPAPAPAPAPAAKPVAE